MMNTLYRFFALILMLSFSFSANLLAQQEEDQENPRSWKYFKILARADDDSIFIMAQDDLGIDPKHNVTHGASSQKECRMGS